MSQPVVPTVAVGGEVAGFGGIGVAAGYRAVVAQQEVGLCEGIGGFEAAEYGVDFPLEGFVHFFELSGNVGDIVETSGISVPCPVERLVIALIGVADPVLRQCPAAVE